jgi:hypothetical protein
LPQRLKSTFFEKKIVEGHSRRPGVKRKYQKMLILVFEVIVQPPKRTSEIGFFFVFLLIVMPVWGNLSGGTSKNHQTWAHTLKNIYT